MKFRLSTQLHAGVAVAMLMALATSGAAWWVTLRFERAATVEHHQIVASTIALSEAETALWQLRYGFPQFMVGDEQARRLILEDEPKWYALIESKLDAYAQVTRADAERSALAELRAEYLRYKEARPKFFELYGAGRIDDAIAWRALTTTPYGAATEKAFERQIELARTQLANEAREETLLLERIRFFLTLLSGLLLALLALGYWAALRALRPIRALQALALRTVEEQLNVRLDVAGGSEIESVVESVERMSAAFVTHAQEMGRAQEDLQQLNRDLERRVAERTGELERAMASLERRNRDAVLLAELSGLLQSCHSVEEAGALIARYCEKAYVQAPGAVYLFQASRNYLERLAAWGEPAPVLSFAPAECWALRRGRIHRAQGVEVTLACAHARHGAPDTLCIPLSAQEGAFGVLYLEAGVESEAAAREMAEQVALALSNLRLRQRLRDQSIRDVLTGLFNRRYLEESLERELARAERDRQPIAVFMLDVDHFKRFNDAYGHDAGDAVLAALGRLLKDCARVSDIACRFGGEEFTVVLPGLTPAESREWAARLMERVRAMDVRAGGGQALPGVTISMGLACYPDHGFDVETLLQAADLALYEAKHAGRDRLAVAGANRGSESRGWTGLPAATGGS